MRFLRLDLWNEWHILGDYFDESTYCMQLIRTLSSFIFGPVLVIASWV